MHMSMSPRRNRPPESKSFLRFLFPSSRTDLCCSSPYNPYRYNRQCSVPGWQLSPTGLTFRTSPACRRSPSCLLWYFPGGSPCTLCLRKRSSAHSILLFPPLPLCQRSPSCHPLPPYTSRQEHSPALSPRERRRSCCHRAAST